MINWPTQKKKTLIPQTSPEMFTGNRKDLVTAAPIHQKQALNLQLVQNKALFMW